MTHRLSLDHIAEAARTIDPVFLATPQFVSEPLSGVVGARVVVKIETLNPVRCFKGRGADYYASMLSAGAEVVTASSGNLGQALAYACRRRGARLVVFAATGANPLKLARMRALGADVRLVGADFDAAKIEGRRFAATLGLPFVEDGVEPRLAEGAGSIAVELLNFPERLDAVLVSLGDAILGGMARWISAHAPAIEVIGVAAAGAPCMAESFRLGRPVDGTDRTLSRTAWGRACRCRRRWWTCVARSRMSFWWRTRRCSGRCGLRMIISASCWSRRARPGSRHC